MHAVDIETGLVKWTFGTGRWVFGTPVVVDGVVYFGSDDGHVYALD